MRVAGGFRTRYVPSWARLLWRTLRNHLHPMEWQTTMANTWDGMQRRDRQRVCPHPAHAQESMLEGYVDCRECGACLRNPSRYNVPAHQVTEPADGNTWERRNQRVRAQQAAKRAEVGLEPRG